MMAVDAMANMVQYSDVTGAVWARYYGYYLPEILYRMIPVASLMATIMTISVLQRGNELTALFSIGMSLTRIATPILIWVVLLCGVVLFLSDQILPNFAKNKNFIFYHEVRKNPSLYSTVKTDRIWYRSRDMIFNIKTLNEKAQKAQGLTLYFFNDAWDLIQMMTAEEVDLLGSQWLLKKGSVTIFSEESSFPLTSRFETKTILMGEDAKDLSSTANTADILSLSELSRFIDKNREAGLDTVSYEVAFHSKFGFALAGLIMSLLGLPFSVGKARSGGLMLNIGICLGLVFLYWIFYSSSLTLGNHGQIHPIVAAWAPNLISAAIAIFAMKRLKR
jgi:lipopolysaccharide export system permease protein